MTRNLAIVIVVIGALIIFQPHIKAAILEAQNSFALARVEVSEEKKTELRRAISRIADGYRQRAYTEVESVTLREKLAEMRGFAGKELSDTEADALLRRFETILERYKL